MKVVVVLSILSKQLFPIKSENVRKCFAKISRRKFPDNLKRVTMKNQYAKISVWESVLNEIAGINFRLASLKKKRLHQRIYQNFQRFYRKVLQKPSFFIMLRAAHYRLATSLGSWSTIDFFLKIRFFKTASVWYIFNCPFSLSPLCLVLGKNIQFFILVFLEVQEINL